jgi:predicted  nucleic acid-binding Zn-ribbon protein
MSEIVTLRKRLDSQSAGMERLLRENAELQTKVTLLELEKRQWQAEKATQSAIIAQRLMAMNAERSDMAQEIEVLKATIKALVGET